MQVGERPPQASCAAWAAFCTALLPVPQHMQLNALVSPACKISLVRVIIKLPGLMPCGPLGPYAPPMQPSLLLSFLCSCYL